MSHHQLCISTYIHTMYMHVHVYMYTVYIIVYIQCTCTMYMHVHVYSVHHKGISITMCVWIPLIANGFIQLAHVYVCCLFCQSEPLLSCWGVFSVYIYTCIHKILALFPGSPPCELFNSQKLGRMPGRFCMSASVGSSFISKIVHVYTCTCMYTFNNN